MEKDRTIIARRNPGYYFVYLEDAAWKYLMVAGQEKYDRFNL